MSYQAYQKTQQGSEDPRQTEYRLFAKITGALMDAADKPLTDPAVIKAVDWNRRMWGTFAADCGASGNGLPSQTRASIISLALWVGRHSSAVMRGNADIKQLIKINRSIMTGLNTQAAASQSGQSPSDQTGATGSPSVIATLNNVV